MPAAAAAAAAAVGLYTATGLRGLLGPAPMLLLLLPGLPAKHLLLSV